MVALCQESPHDNGKEPDVTFFFRHWRENSLYVASAGPQHPDFGRFRGPAHGLLSGRDPLWEMDPLPGLTYRERKRCLKLPRVRGGFWQSSAERWEGQRNYSLKDSLHKDANSCFSIRKDQRIEVRAKSVALHSPFARKIFVTWVSCEHGLCARRLFWPKGIISKVSLFVKVMHFLG